MSTAIAESRIPADSMDGELRETQAWLNGPRFAGIVRLYTAREVIEQRGTIRNDYAVARSAAEAFYDRLRQLFIDKKCITTFGPYSPGQAVTIKRMGIEAIYLGGWATSAKGSTDEDPGPDLASYPLSQVPNEAAAIVRALMTADRNQHFQRSRMTEEERSLQHATDYRPFIIADADTGHGGDPHVRNLIRRFVEVGVPGYHIEDQRPGTKKCGHQGGKVLVAQDEQIKRLNAARFQLDVMGVPGIIVARTDAEAASLVDGSGDERDQPFILGATNVTVPSYKIVTLAVHKRFFEEGVREVRGHLLYAISDREYEQAYVWLGRTGLMPLIEQHARACNEGSCDSQKALDRILTRLVEVWEVEAGLETYGGAVADAMELRLGEGEQFAMTVPEWRQFAGSASFASARAKAKSLGIRVNWDCELAKTPEGYYQVQGGVRWAIAKSLAAAPFADLLWMETATADLKEAREFAEAIHAVFPEKMLAYNLSPSFSWDTTGMSDDEMRQFPEELGKLGYVFNFITYGGHQIDGVAAEEFATALRQDGMLALARLQRKIRLLESPYRTPQSLVGGPRLDEALAASSGRTATTKAMGKGSTQHQHLVQTEVPVKLLEGWIAQWCEHYGLPGGLQVKLRPYRSGSELLELSLRGEGDLDKANIVFGIIVDRHGGRILSVRDMNTRDESFRQKRLMTLMHLFLIHRYKIDAAHYLRPSEDNIYQTSKMKSHKIFSEVSNEIGEIIVADVNQEGIEELIASDGVALGKLIRKEA
jgi:isocitrate lyase